jgi:hypothetical protein
MVLLGICVAAVVVGMVRLATERTPLPTGSSYSTQSDGTMALFAWLEAAGSHPAHAREATVDPATSTLIVLQPESTIEPLTRQEYDRVAERGGTLVLAGDSVAWLFYSRALGVMPEPIGPGTFQATSPDGLTLAWSGRFRLHADASQTLLTRADGNVVALRMPYKQGNLIVIASPEPLTNDGLRDSNQARFVFRQLVAPAAGQTVAFDELHHTFAPTPPGTTTMNSLLFNTPPGRAVIYAVLLTFAFLVLGGRRLGPPLRERLAAEVPRTMYEHVQMLANLYRRAGQFDLVRSSLTRHYVRLLARGRLGAKRIEELNQSIARMQAARSVSELVAALAQMSVDDAG